MIGMFNEWLANVGGQIAAGVGLAVLASIAGLFTPWGKLIFVKVKALVSRAWRTLRSIRVTTRPRIDAEVRDAVNAATAAFADEAEDDEPRPVRHDEHEGWVLGPASQPRHWELRNQTRDTVTVEAILPGGNYWPFEWEDPDLPMTVAPGEVVLIRARRLRGGNSLMPWMAGQVMANVLYEDEHGDEREDIIWILD